MNYSASNSVRLANIADAASIARIQVDGWRKAYADIVSREFLEAMDYKTRTKRWREILSASEAKTAVHETNGCIGGWASYGPSRDEDFDGSEIWGIYVAPSAWRRKVGRSLVEFVHADPDTGAESIVWVLKENLRAQSFYRAVGYFPDGKEKTVQIGGEDLPELRYRRSC